MDDVERELWSKALRALRERPLWCGEVRTPAYRFLWLEAFDSPTLVRVWSDGHTWWLHATELDRSGGELGGRVSRQVQRQLTRSEAAVIRQGLGRLDMWNSPAQDARHVLDGSTWVIEAREANRYHVIERNSPGEGPVMRFGSDLLRMTGWAFQPGNIF